LYHVKSRKIKYKVVLYIVNLFIS